MLFFKPILMNRDGRVARGFMTKPYPKKGREKERELGLGPRLDQIEGQGQGIGKKGKRINHSGIYSRSL